ncbi:YhdP family protein [Rhodoferax sp.]|uniref:YhdP family protein n=1 Tax=Rhodoferax sp. TaxID=50421 RepID=UPI00260ED5C0|nr:YhdP family protein [Rhodoferax sp.]MDD2918209.1 YhdP family protein [Rhodoferax sp.]
MPPLPSKLLKTWTVLTRWLLAAVVLAWLLLALAWGALHWVIVPRIAEFRPQLEARATQALGVTVRVGAVSAQSNGMVPSFELTDVALLDAQGRVGLSLPRILIAVSPRSLWRLGFEQIYLDQPILDIRRAPDGKITIGGLDFNPASRADPAALDWFFSQFEFAIHDGALRWTDELRMAEPVVLQNVAAVVRNRGREHDVRLDATPPESWGSTFSLQGRFLQPLLSRRQGHWQDWEGQIYAAFERADLSELRRYVQLGVDLRQGNGALRAWVDVDRGRITQVVADVALSEVRVVLGADLQPLALHQLQGRLGGRKLADGFEFSTQALTFDTQDGLHWPGGNASLQLQQAQAGQLERGEFKADRLDLGALAQIVSRLPLDDATRDKLRAYAPKGQVDTLQASWQGSWRKPQKYAARGRLSRLEIAAVASTPGLSGLDVDFDFNQQAGQARLGMAAGSVDLPNIFQQPVVPVDSLSAEARWQIKSERIAVQLDKVKFANADAAGEAQIKWQSADPAKSASGARSSGVLDLQANLSRADGKQVHRYLPLVIDPAAREYVRDAVQEGRASSVRFQIKGDIDQMPMIDPKEGAFKITAQVEGARLAYVPTSLQDSGDLPWPVLTDLSGELVIDRMQLQVNKARARLGDATSLQVSRVEARIADLMQTQVEVDADFKGPLPELLGLVNTSPLSHMLGQALVKSAVMGNADYKLRLMLPIARIDQSSVRGSILLTGNDVRITPDSPKLTQARGRINFTEAGFSLSGVQARMLGGDARLEGGWLLVPGSPGGRGAPTLIRASGSASAEGLRQAAELGFVARLARRASGSAAYTATLGWRQGATELLVNSNLQGLALSLPAPLGKSAEALLPLRLETGMLADAPAPLQDRVSLSLANLVQVMYERDVSQAVPRVLRGAIAVGLDAQESAPMPSAGVSANLRLQNFNVDAWRDVLAQTANDNVTASLVADGNALLVSYLPTQLAVRSEVLTFGGRQFNHIVMGGGREGTLWRANLAASELNGYLEYRQSNEQVGGGAEGRVYARLARLTLAPGVEADVDALLDAQPTSIPALDIVVDDFELRGKHLGRLEVEAVNRSRLSAPREAGVREWHLNKFNLGLPEASLVASGNWAALTIQAQDAAMMSAQKTSAPRRTEMNFALDIADSGALLDRLGMKNVVRGGRGKLEGQVAWLGSPLTLDYPSLSGSFTVNVASGQFLQAEPGIAKLLGVLSLQALPRRLTLDFRDVFSEGFSFDFLRGDVTIEKGMARTNNLQMKGVNAAVLMEGSADIARETQDIKVVVIPEISSGTASLLLATVINPAIGLGTFLAELFLRRPMIESATQEFHIDGSWADPHITKVLRTKTNNPEKQP